MTSPDPADREGSSEFIQAQRELTEVFGFKCFNDALRSWIATVAIVEVEFVGEWEDYTNELMAREYLAQIRLRASGEWEKRLRGKVEPWDERFTSATAEEAEPHLELQDGIGGWWWYRTPRRWRRPTANLLRKEPR